MYLELVDRLNGYEPVALAVAAVAVAAAWLGPLPPRSPVILLAYFAVVASALLVHELAHRWVAVRRGCSARFILDPRGLALTLLSTVLPVKILAPGYVGVYCWAGEGVEAISAAGPASNIALALLSLLVSTLLPASWRWITGEAAALNAWIAFFNLIPVPPLDGSKILGRNPGLWAVLLAFSILLMYSSAL